MSQVFENFLFTPEMLDVLNERDFVAAVPHAHFASTSQDVIDTALALVTQRALDLIERDTQRAVAALHTLAATPSV